MSNEKPLRTNCFPRLSHVNSNFATRVPEGVGKGVFVSIAFFSPEVDEGFPVAAGVMVSVVLSAAHPLRPIPSEQNKSTVAVIRVLFLTSYQHASSLGIQP